MIEIGFLVGTIFVALIVLAAITTIIVVYKRDVYEKGIVTVIVAIIAAVILGFYAFMAFPYDMKYHSYKPVAGTVEKVSSRLVSDGDKSVNQKFVVIFKGDPQEYGCVDTRCSLVKPGDQLNLSCIQVWVYAGTDGFDCQFVKREE